MNILGKRYIFFGLSLLIIVTGLICLFIADVPLSIDFTGGSLLELKFANASPQPAEIIAVYEAANIGDAQVQTTGDGTYNIRSEFLDNDQRAAVLDALNEKYGGSEVIRFDSVGPSIGQQVTSRGALAIVIASILVVLVHCLVVPRSGKCIPLWHLRDHCHDP